MRKRLMSLFFARAISKMHKNVSNFLCKIPSCILRRMWYNNNCQGEMEKGEQNAAIEKKFSNARWKKPLDKNKKVCYNKTVKKLDFEGI